MLALPVVVIGATPVGATASFTLTRLAGADRYATAQQVAAATFVSADTAILATGANFPDALAASFLAGNQAGGAPILLTTVHDPIPAATLSSLNSLKVKNVIIVGGTSAVGDDVATTLGQTASSNTAGGNLSVTRLSGPTRYDTMAAIDTATGTAVGTFNGKKTAFVATGADFPDALGAGPVSYAEKFPVVLTYPTSLAPQARSTLTALGIQQVLVLGGTAAVSAGVESAINAMGIPTLQRFAGTDRSNTAQLVADYAVTNFKFSKTLVDVASGDESFGGADALASGPLGGTSLVPTLITDSVTNAGSALGYASEHAATLTGGFALGGTDPLPDSTVRAIEAAGGNTSASQAIALNSTTVPAGGTLSGTVASPSTVAKITANGCGLTNQAVTFSSSTGAFSLTIPATQAAGTCQLSFAVTYNNGTAGQTDTFTITVNHSTAALAAPTLASVTVARAAPPANDTATFTFNQALSSAIPSAAAFRLYRASGAYSSGVGAPAATTNGWTVSFPPGSADNVTLGAVQAGAVTNAAGDKNFPGSVAASGPAATLTTSEPDLTGVGTPTAVGTTSFTVVYTFDKAVQTTPNGAGTFCVIPTAGSTTPVFEVVESNGTVIPESSTTPPYSMALTGGQTTCSPSTTVTATFPGNLANLTLVAGAVDAGRVQGSGGDTTGNPLGSQPISGASASPSYPVLEQAVETYAAGTTTTDVTLIYSTHPGSPAPAGGFNLIEGSGQEVPATATPTAGTDPSTLLVSFPSTALATAVGVAVSVNAVPSAPDTAIALTGQGATVGPVVLPDLTGVTVTPASGIAGPTVTFTFDKKYTAATAPGSDFAVYTSQGVGTAAAGTGTISGNTVVFSCQLAVSCMSGFSASQLAGMAAAGVQDTSTDNPPIAPEAAVT